MQFGCQPGTFMLLSIDEHAAKAHLLVSCGMEPLPLTPPAQPITGDSHRDLTGPLTKLAAISGDPVGAWRREDAVAIHGLAALELRAAGVRLRH